MLTIYKSIKQSRGSRDDVNIENIKKKFFKSGDKKNNKQNDKNKQEPDSVFTDADFDNIFK